MEVAAYLRILAKYWWVVVACILIGAGAGFGNAALRTKEYQSVATLLVSAIPGSTVTEAYQNGAFAQDRANTYSSLATSEQVAARAVNKLGSRMSADDLRSKITSATLPGTMMFTVAVTDSDAGQAQTYANAVIDELSESVNELESRGTDKPVAGVMVVNPPSYPTSVIGLGRLLRIVLGAVGGLLVGLLVAVLAGVLDRRVRGRADVEALTGSFVLGGLPKDKYRAKRGAVDLGAGGSYAERLRELRTNLRFTALVGSDPPVKVLAVTSPSAHAGRTALAVDLAAALAETERSVILIEGDLRHPVLAKRLDVEHTAQSRGLSGVLAGEYSLEDAIIPALSVGDVTIDCLLAGPAAGSPGQLWSTDDVAASVIRHLHDRYDYSVIDTPALDEYNDGVDIGLLADGVLLLARIHVSSSSALQRAIRTLQGAKVNLIGTVVTCERTRWGSFDGPDGTVAADDTESHENDRDAEHVSVAQSTANAKAGRHHAGPGPS